MYSKDQASQLKQGFWTAFGLYISPQLSSEGLKVNWINYKTGIKHVYFKMEADKHSATIAVSLAHPDPGIQELFFEQFKEYATMFNSCFDKPWEWELHGVDEYGKTISRIYTQIDGVNILNKSDWPTIISFFKPRIIKLDEFWNDVKDGFEGLR